MTECIERKQLVHQASPEALLILRDHMVLTGSLHMNDIHRSVVSETSHQTVRGLVLPLSGAVRRKEVIAASGDEGTGSGATTLG